MPKTVKRIWNIVTTLILLIVVVAAVLMAGGQIFGMRPFAVLSGSMQPELPVGALIYVKPTEFEDIQVGDVITFVLNEDLDVATHRIVEINTEETYFITKGDANKTEDIAPVHYNNVVGVLQYSIPYLGYVSSWVTQPPGLIIVIIGAVIFLILMFLPDMLDKAAEADRKAALEQAEKEQQEDHSQE